MRRLMLSAVTLRGAGRPGVRPETGSPGARRAEGLRAAGAHARHACPMALKITMVQYGAIQGAGCIVGRGRQREETPAR